MVRGIATMQGRLQRRDGEKRVSPDRAKPTVLKGEAPEQAQTRRAIGEIMRRGPRIDRREKVGRTIDSMSNGRLILSRELDARVVG